MNSYRMVVLAVCCSAFVACAEPLPKGPAKTLKTYPHAADRYARLLRRQLMDPDPEEVQQELACEDWRLSRVLGVDESTLRVVGVRDTVLATVSARAAHVRVQRMVAGRSYEMGGALCDSLNAIADREDLIVKVDTTKPPGDTTR